MHKRAVVILFWSLLLLFASCKPEKQTMTIKGEITNLDTTFVLVSYLSHDSLAIDTIYLDEKKEFLYSNPIDTFTVFTFYFNQFNSSIAVFAEKDNSLIMSGDANFPDLIHVSGNGINDQLTRFKKENESLLRQRGELYLTLDKEIQNGDSTANILSYEDKIAKVNALNHQLMHQAEEYIKEHPDKTASLVLINDFFAHGENPQALKRVMGYLSNNISKLPLAMSLSFYLEKINRSAEGKFMPSFTMKDIRDKEIKSDKLLGKYILLSFVSADGEESRKNIQELKGTYRKMGKEKDNIRFISIYIDSNLYPIEHLDTDSIPWTVVAEKKSWASDMVDKYNVSIVPYNILIDPKGIIKERNIAAQDVEFAVKKKASKRRAK